jgi:hypothetical protein
MRRLMKRLLFVFLDGVGLAPDAPSNPLSSHTGPALRRLAGGQRWDDPFPKQRTKTHLVRSLDATLGVEGLPQSGTGQATLMSGANCAQLVGRHFGPFPHSKTHDVLDRANLFHNIQSLFPGTEAPAAFANAFPPQYFSADRRRPTVTTHCCQAAEVEIRTIEALRTGRALPADLTGASWRELLGLDVAPQEPGEAGATLARTARKHAFTLFEYFLTDKVGHSRIDTPPAVLLDQLDDFFDGLLQALDPASDALLITSDHGNLEDTSHTQHTRNPVPLIVHGWAAPYFEGATDLTDVAPGIVRALRDGNGPAP